MWPRALPKGLWGQYCPHKRVAQGPPKELCPRPLVKRKWFCSAWPGPLVKHRCFCGACPRPPWLVKAQTPPKSETLTNPDPLGLHVLAVVSPWKPPSRKPDIVLKPVAPKLKKDTSVWDATKPAQRLPPFSTQRQPPPPMQKVARDQNATDISESALVAIQSAIAAALAPLQRKIDAMDLELQEMG